MKLENKYNIDDVIWFVADNKIQSAEITQIDIDINICKREITQNVKYRTYLVSSRGMLSEDEIYSSKRKLVINM